MKKIKTKIMKEGTITPALLVISSAFIIAIYGLLFILTLQFDYSNRQLASEKALHIADAGVNYYRWHLTQYPEDYQDGTGESGPYLHDYSDPQGGIIGKFSLEITAPTQASPIITITSTGWTNQYPRVKRVVRAQYGLVALTRFSFLHNSNLWFGNNITVNGPVFSNGGIRQDGTNTSTVESAKETYICGLETGCTNPEEKPGVWGTGKIKELWKYPVAPIDFDSIKVDFNQMKVAAQESGLYLEPSGAQGYHLVFSNDGNFTVYKVTGTDSFKGYSLENGCENLYQTITSEQALDTYSVANNQIVFIEDTIWVDGIVNGRTTVVAARFPIGTFNTNIWITDNLSYLNRNGSHRLGLIAQKDIIFGRDIPEYFEVNGAILAQNGRIIRHHYNYFDCSHSSDKMKNEFKFFGSLISNQRSYWNFSSGPKSPASGFTKSILDYDQSLYSDPPPYFPSTQQYEFLSWSEEK